MEDNKIPYHVAIIMDGNGRWAKERGKVRSYGHEIGAKTLKELALYAFSKGVKVLSVFAFSTENFKRSEEEVGFLMNLFIKGFKNDTWYFNKENVKVIFSGRKERLKEEVINAMKKMEADTVNNTNGTLNICLNYGGRAEIVDATNKIISEGCQKVTEETFKNYLYQDLPDIDLLIRTSGELRISNFMLWQLSYAELYFPNCYFPDFNESEYDKALIEYTKRDRRFGGLNNE